MYRETRSEQQPKHTSNEKTNIQRTENRVKRTQTRNEQQKDRQRKRTNKRVDEAEITEKQTIINKQNELRKSKREGG